MKAKNEPSRVCKNTQPQIKKERKVERASQMQNKTETTHKKTEKLIQSRQFTCNPGD